MFTAKNAGLGHRATLGADIRLECQGLEGLAGLLPVPIDEEETDHLDPDARDNRPLAVANVTFEDLP
jgi:hypothetical protein